MTSPAPTSGGPLYAVHRVLISAAIGLGAILVVWGVASYRSSGLVTDLLLGASGAVAAVIGGFYLRWFRKKARTS